MLLSWRNTVGWFTNTDPSAAVTFRDDGSPEHNYLPAIGAGVGQRNRWIDTPGLTGVLLEGAPSQPIAEGQGQWCLAVPDQLEGVEVMRCSRWDPSGDGGEIWEAFSRDGSIPNSNNDRRSTGSEQASAAIALRLRLEPGAEIELPVVISWDLPVTAFATGTSALRRYTDFFGATGDNAVAIAAEALGAWRQWRDAIEAWQKPVLERSDLPEPLRMALLNELYDLASGGSLWTAASSTDPVGRFGVLECLDYAWYESLDVRLYGSFALLQLWPELDKAVLRSFARAIPAADATPRPIGWYFTQGRGRVEAARKLAGATPTTWAPPTSGPSMPPTTPPIKTATSGRTWPPTSCCRSGGCSVSPHRGKTCASWPTAGRRWWSRFAISSSSTSTTTACPTTAARLIRPLTTGHCRE